MGGSKDTAHTEFSQQMGIHLKASLVNRVGVYYRVGCHGFLIPLKPILYAFTKDAL